MPDGVETPEAKGRRPVLAVVVGRDAWVNVGLTNRRVEEREQDRWEFPITSSDPIFDLYHRWELEELLDQGQTGVRRKGISYAANRVVRAHGKAIRHHYYRDGDEIWGLRFAPTNPGGTETLVEASPFVERRIRRMIDGIEALTASGVRIPEAAVVDLVTHNNAAMPFDTMERIAYASFGLAGMYRLIVEDPNVLVRAARERELAARGLRRVIPKEFIF